MSRAWRKEYKGGIYHVIARGNNKEYIFKESIDKGYFIKLLKDHCNIRGYQIFGYVLMDNHYHVVIQPMDKKLQQITLKEIGDHIGMTAVSVMNMLDKSLE
ncbi:MAG TPA: transposase [Patescibacteria group bacterium]|nr:transposase [Patescibacteria group bacterium]